MSAKTCPFDGCDEAVRQKRATEMPTQLSSDGSVRTYFTVRYCGGGHVLGYDDRQEPAAGAGVTADA